jgi:hypothetical protein
MKKILIIILLLQANLLAAQQVQTSAAELTAWETPENSRIDASLYQVGTLALTNKVQADRETENREFRTSSETGGKLINVEIVYKNDYTADTITDEIDVRYLESLGFKVQTFWENRASVWISTADILRLGEKLPDDYFMFAVYNDLPDNEGPGDMNSDTYQTASTGGNGIRVGIIDSGYQNLQLAINASAAPTPAYMWRAGSQQFSVAVMSVDTQHGTGCLETAFDHAPNSVFEIYDSGNMTELGNAVTRCIANGVDIISHSKSTYNLGWGDNTGAACIAAQNAVNNGMLFFTSCGNRAQSHWEGSFADANSNNWHDWSGSDEFNNITVNSGGYCRASLSWNPVTNSNYDVYIYRISDNFILASSTNGGTTFEDTGWTNNTASSVAVGISVRKIGSASPTFEVFSHNSNTSSYQYQVASGSNTSPSNSTSSNIISVGAVNTTNYASAVGVTGIIMNYSSQGPTNSGNLAPKVSAPTNTTTVAYSGAFGGTSCATPNAAGMTAAFWSANSYLDNSGVRQVLFRKADLFKDWGANGSDNVYGWGGLFLYDRITNARYLYRGGSNALGFANRPFYTFNQAQSGTPDNGTVLILGGTYPEGITLGTGSGLSKDITYKSVVIKSEVE